MKAVILAAGKGTRCCPLTLTRPKALLKVANKTILELQLMQLKGVVDEIIIIVGYRKEMIIDYCKNKWNNNYQGIKLTFVDQVEKKGTAHALLQVKDLLKNEQKFICMNGDDLYDKNDIKEVVKFDLCLLLQKVEDPTSYGVAKIHDEYIEFLVEKSNDPPSDLVNCGLYVFSNKIFECAEKIKESPRGEFEITDAINELSKHDLFNYHITSNWMSMSYSWQLLDVNKKLLDKLEKNIHTNAIIEDNVTFNGNVEVGEGTIIKSGSYIEGPVSIGENCTIGPNCYIRPSSSIGDNCKVGNGCEVKNSIMFKKVSIGHLSYLGDSILGENINFGAGTIVANLRHDNKPVKTELNGKLIEVGRKFGTVIGDNVKTGIKCSIYPGRKLYPHTSTLPCEVVKHDLKGEGN